MGVFKSSELLPYHPKDLRPAAEDLMSHFRIRGFEVIGSPTLTGGWDVSINKGGLLKAVLGMKTALKISLEPAEQGTAVKAGIGVFGQQVVPTVIMLYVFWPVLLSQLWGIIRQSKLDDQAIAVAKEFLSRDHDPNRLNSHLKETHRADTAMHYCTECGNPLTPGNGVCANCQHDASASVRG